MGPRLRKITANIFRSSDHLNILRDIIWQVCLRLILRMNLVDALMILVALIVLDGAGAHFGSAIYLLLLLDLSPTAIFI